MENPDAKTKKTEPINPLAALLFLIALIGFVVLLGWVYFKWYYGSMQPTLIELLTIYLLLKILSR